MRWPLALKRYLWSLMRADRCPARFPLQEVDHFFSSQAFQTTDTHARLVLEISRPDRRLIPLIPVAPQHRKARVFRVRRVGSGAFAQIKSAFRPGNDDAGVPAMEAKPHLFFRVRCFRGHSSISTRFRGVRSRSAPDAGIPTGFRPIPRRAVRGD